MQEFSYTPFELSTDARTCEEESDALHSDVPHIDGSRVREHSENAHALLALSHTQVEHKLYEAMFTRTAGVARPLAFTVRELMSLTGLTSYSTIRRGLSGLVSKLSVERRVAVDAGRGGKRGFVYEVFAPEEIFERRRAAGIEPYPREVAGEGKSLAVRRIAERTELSRREAQVTLLCAEGLSNAEIGARLFISEQTVKFHLRQIFTKMRVRRRAELIAMLLKP